MASSRRAALGLDAVTIGRGAQSLLVLGAHGPEVVRLKKLLKQWSKAHPPPVAFVQNDVFGKNTPAVVKRFQKASGLDDDGKVGEKTWKALQRK
jgi:murein L,D-transpeptidase YcbB/YkuD